VLLARESVANTARTGQHGPEVKPPGGAGDLAERVDPRLGRQEMRTYNVVVERDPQTGLLVGSVPGWPGAHSQAATLDELHTNLREVIEMLLEDGEPQLESEFMGIQTIRVA